MQTIYLQIAAAGGQQLFGRMGGANINYLKQQICVSNTFTKSPKLSILSQNFCVTRLKVMDEMYFRGVA